MQRGNDVAAGVLRTWMQRAVVTAIFRDTGGKDAWKKAHGWEMTQRNGWNVVGRDRARDFEYIWFGLIWNKQSHRIVEVNLTGNGLRGTHANDRSRPSDLHQILLDLSCEFAFACGHA